MEARERFCLLVAKEMSDSCGGKRMSTAMDDACERKRCQVLLGMEVGCCDKWMSTIVSSEYIEWMTTAVTTPSSVYPV